MYADPSEHFEITLTALLIDGLIVGAIGASVGLGATIYNDVKDDGVINGDWTDCTGRILGGFVLEFHPTVFIKLIFQKSCLVFRLLVENAFTAGFKLFNAFIKSYLLGRNE